VRRVLLIVLVLLAAGCGSQGGQKSATPDTTEAPATTEAPLVPDTTEEPPTTAGSTEQQVNDTVEFQDGVKMTVLGLNRNARRSSYAAGGHPGDQTVVVTVKVTNGADHPIDLAVTLSCSYGADGNAAEEVYDSESGYNGIDQPAKLQPGRSATGKYAFAVQKGRAKNLVFTGQPGYDYEEQTWTAA
jgi:hypothetical protein